MLRTGLVARSGSDGAARREKRAGYAFEVARDAEFTLIDVSGSVVDSAVDQLIFPGTRYWRIRVLDARGDGGPWSETRHFTIECPNPPGPIPCQ